MVTLSSIHKYIENRYPAKYSADWDNVGLQVGSSNNEIKKVLVCLTITSDVVARAIETGANLILSHHPLIFNKLSKIDTSSYQGKIIEKLIQNNISAYSAHTNFDVNVNGVSDILASSYGFKKTKVLSPIVSELFKLVVYVPVKNYDEFRDSFLELQVGNIGAYSNCSFSSVGEGTFLPGEGSRPYIGEEGTLERVQEIKLETIVKEAELDNVVSLMKNLHPYEEPAYDIFPMKNKDKSIGYGRYARVTDGRHVGDFLWVFQGQLKGSGDGGRKVNKIAFSGGSGSSFVKKAASMGIDLLITGDIDYHAGVEAYELGLTILDIGHEQSEWPAVHYLTGILTEQFPEIEFFT